jgi:hypothetical protein
MPKIITPSYLARTGTEHGEQTALFCWASVAMRQGFDDAFDESAYGKVSSRSFAHPELRWMHAIPNGGGRTAVQGGMLKAEGVKAGVADVCLPVVRRYQHGVYAGLYLELKKRTATASAVSQEQLEFAVFVIRQGYVWLPCFGWEQAAHAVASYMTSGPYEHSDHQMKVLKKVWEAVSASNPQVSSTTH